MSSLHWLLLCRYHHHTWTINNRDSDSKNGTGVAMLDGIGQLGSLIERRLYPNSDAPHYIKGCPCVQASCWEFLGYPYGCGSSLFARTEGRRYSYIAVSGEDKERLIDEGVENKQQKRFMYIL